MPREIALSAPPATVAAVGAGAKNRLCLLTPGRAWLSDATGPLGDPDHFARAARTCRELARAADTAFTAVACDLHPDLPATRLAERLADEAGVPLRRVQHHHAHVAAVAAEHDLAAPVVGLALDGTGWGEDGTSWGGECLLLTEERMTRTGHLAPLPLPGGDVVAREPWRMAVAALSGAPGGVALARRLIGDRPGLDDVARLAASPRTPRSSSAGRLFDAAAAILLGVGKVESEAEAAIALERAAGERDGEEALPFDLAPVAERTILDLRPALRALAEAHLGGASTGLLAARFHATLATGVARLAAESARARAIGDVALAGGCLHNRRLTHALRRELEAEGLRVWQSRALSPGDESVSLGQAWVAAHQLAAATLDA